LGLLGPWILTGLLFYALRRLEVWLHQHIFKVGWLVTKQYQTTTILYYAFFLPGILLNQLTVWIVAGMLNVRADRSIAWPQKQEIGELKLNFVQLAKNTDPFRVALINTSPLVVGMIAIWHIANNILNTPAFLESLGGSGLLGNVASAASELTAAPDFWLWFYTAFTISNTMMPKFQSLRGWRVIFIAVAIIAGVLFLVGAGNQVVLTNSLNALSGILGIMISLDLVMLAVLGTLEAIIERITGDSATFVNGKMITMRRAEMLAQRAKALAPQPKAAKSVAAPSGPPSVYKLQFTIPGPPGKETVTRDEGLIITADPKLSLPSSAQPAQRPSTPAVISGTVTEKLPASTESKPPQQPQIKSPIPATSQPVPQPQAKPPTSPTLSSPAPVAKPPAASPTTASPKPTTVPVPSPFTSPAKPTQASPTPSSPALSPARPTLSSPSPAKPPTPSPFSPAPKPTPPTSKPVLDDEDDEEAYDDETTYEDFEDPA
jgi:hypothetical protein